MVDVLDFNRASLRNRVSTLDCSVTAVTNHEISYVSPCSRACLIRGRVVIRDCCVYIVAKRLRAIDSLVNAFDSSVVSSR